MTKIEFSNFDFRWGSPNFMKFLKSIQDSPVGTKVRLFVNKRVYSIERVEEDLFRLTSHSTGGHLETCES